MKKQYLVIFLYNILCIHNLLADMASSIKKYIAPTSIDIIKRVNVTSNLQKNINQQINASSITVYAKNHDIKVAFINDKLRINDTVLLNLDEKQLINIKNSNSLEIIKDNLIPIIYWSGREMRKEFGFISLKKIKFLKEVKYDPVSVNDILKHHTPGMTVVYVLCPHRRDNLCRIMIKHNDQWIKNSKDDILVLHGIARSRYNINYNRDDSSSIRLAPNSDTPQGIYGLYASILSEDPLFGLMPRIDLDMSSGFSISPINGFPYNIFSSVVDALVPKNAQQDYWVNEWPLAYALGRSAIRIHTNPSNIDKDKFYMHFDKRSFHRTSGCINLESDLSVFLNILKKIGVFNNNYAIGYKSNSSIGEYVIANNIGYNFVIVLDIPLVNENLGIRSQTSERARSEGN